MSNQTGIQWQAGDIILDLYKVIGILGQSWLGEVYKVRHLGWQTDLIVQNPSSALVTQLGGIEPFQRRVEAWGNLGLHPQIVSCYYLRPVDGHPLVFNEYVAGDSLRHWINDRRLYANGTAFSLQRILDIAIQWIGGMSYLHEQGIIHPDITPETVLIASDGQVKVAGFGLDPGLAQADLIAYRAPESSDQDRLTPQAKLRSWGLSVLEMFAGERAWSAEERAATALEHYLNRETAVQPAGSVAGSAIPRMPVPVAQLLERCFQANQEHSFTFAEIANQLQAIYAQVMSRPYPRPVASASVPFGAADRLNNQAVLLWDLGQHQESLARWEQAIAVQPRHLESIYNRGLVLWRSGQVKDDHLVQQLEDSRSSNPNWQIDELLSLVHIERGDYQTALHLLEGIRAQGIQREQISATLAMVQERLPYSKQLLPNFRASSTSGLAQPNADQITAISLGSTSRYGLAGGEDGTIRLWDISTSRLLSIFRGHQERVSAVTFSPDGCYVLSGSEDQTVQLWNVADTDHIHSFDGRKRRVASRYRVGPVNPMAALFSRLGRLTGQRQPKAHQGAVRSVDFSPDGRSIASGGDDKIIKLWEVETGKCLKIFQGHSKPVLALLFTPDRQHLLSASADQTIKQWELASGRVIQTFDGHRDLTAMACSADGRYVAAANPIQLWDMTTGQVVQTFEQQGARAISFSPDGRSLLSAGDDRQLNLWDVASGRCLRSFTGHELAIRAIALSSEGDYLLSADAATLKWWAVYSTAAVDLAPLRLSQPQPATPQIASDQLYAQDLAQAQVALDQGNAAAAAQHIRQARAQIGQNRGVEAMQAWLGLYRALPRRSFNSGWEQTSFDRYSQALRSVAFSPEGNLILTGSADTTLQLWDRQTSRCLLSFEGHKNEITAVAFSPAFNLAGRFVCSASADTTLKIWSLSSGACLRTCGGHSAAVQSVAVHPAGHLMVSGSRDAKLKLWEVSTGRCLRTFGEHRDGVMAVAFSPDGRSVVSASADQTLKQWNLDTGDSRSFEGHKAAVNSVALSADSRYALSGSDDHTCKLWNLLTGDCMRTFTEHTAAVRSVSLSTNGRYALSGSDDKTCRLWNLLTGECLWIFTGHTAAVRSVSFSADDRYALSGSDDKTCKLCILDWELAEPSAIWEQEASLYLEAFLRLHTPAIGVLPASREPSAEEITLVLTYQGTPTWTDSDFSNLIQTLSAAGYGWINADQVRQQLTRLVAAIAKPIEQPLDATVFGTEFATVFGNPETSARVILTVTAGSLKGQEFAFRERTICIMGRAKDCHIQLPNDEQHKTISRYHCLLDINPPIVRIRDLGSLDGTYINGQMIGRRQRHQTPEQAAYTKFSGHDLSTGDEIKLGPTVFRIQLEAEQTNEAPSPATMFGRSAAVESSAPLSPAPVPGSDSNLLDIQGYTLVRQLDAGEPGQLYLARHSTHGLITLKVMVPQKAVRAFAVDAFLQEVESIKALQHPNIARLLDSGYANGAFFFALDHCSGGNVMDLVQQRGGRLPVSEAVAITLQVLEGLEYAHSSQGLFHGDLKPTCVLLTAAESVQVAKIADYGLAKAFDQAGLKGLSMSGTAVDLPAFMPRQQAVKFNYASAEVDVWAITACLYYMLTGAYPRDFSSGKDPYLVLLQSDPVAIREREAAIPQPLAALIDQALVDNPEIRFKTAAAFKKALKAVL